MSRACLRAASTWKAESSMPIAPPSRGAAIRVRALSANHCGSVAGGTARPKCRNGYERAVEQAVAGEPFRGESRYFWSDGTEHVVDFASRSGTQSAVWLWSFPLAWISPNASKASVFGEPMRKNVGAPKHSPAYARARNASGPRSSTRHCQRSYSMIKSKSLRSAEAFSKNPAIRERSCAEWRTGRLALTANARARLRITDRSRPQKRSATSCRPCVRLLG
jgi:hypothetical protein